MSYLDFFLYFQLAELLGFTKLDLIQELLTHRQSIVSSMLENSDRLLSSSSDTYGTPPHITLSKHFWYVDS